MEKNTSMMEITFRIPGNKYADLPLWKAFYDDNTCKITDSLTRETFNTPHQWVQHVHERETKNKTISSKKHISVGEKRIADIEIGMACTHFKRQARASINRLFVSMNPLKYHVSQKDSTNRCSE